MGFDSFLGNPKAVEAVRQMLEAERVPGALLFAGPDGVGKKTLALMLAKALVCERRQPGGDDFCGECARCRKSDEMLAAARDDLARRRDSKDTARRTEGLVYFDVQLIEPLTRFILIEQVRQLRQVAYTHPFEFPRRVFVVDDAQALHWAAVDVLLKVLEEPPATTTLILVCPNAFEMRATIRSRCRVVPFLPVEDEVILELLKSEGRVPEKQRALVARLAAGSVAKARTLELDDYLARRQPWLEYLGGVAGRSAKSLRSADWRALFAATRALAENRAEFDETLRIGYSLLRDLMILEAGGREAEITNFDVLPRLKGWAPKLGVAGLVSLQAGLDQAYRLQVRNVNQQVGLDALAAELLQDADARTAPENSSRPPVRE